MNQRQLTTHIATLQAIAQDLRAVASQTPLQMKTSPVPLVAISVKGLEENADYLEEVAQDLLSLVPERKVTPPNP